VLISCLGTQPGSVADRSSCTTEQHCPETRESDTNIMILTATLGHPDLLVKMSELGLRIDTLAIDPDEFHRQTDIPGFLRSYWKDVGVERVSDPEVCRSIFTALQADEQSLMHLERYRAVYYKVSDNRYIVLY